MESSPDTPALPEEMTPRELESIWRRERRWVAAVLLAHMDPRDDMEDLLQEVALAFVQHHAELRDPSKLRPWLRTIARNAALGARRKRHSRLRHLRPLDEDARELPDPHAERDRTAVDAREACQRVLERVRALNPKYSEPLLMRCVQGCSQRRIAQVLGLPETTVETRLARARRRLRGAFGYDREGIEP